MAIDDSHQNEHIAAYGFSSAGRADMLRQVRTASSPTSDTRRKRRPQGE
jgi:hypothetical protein